MVSYSFAAGVPPEKEDDWVSFDPETLRYLCIPLHLDGTTLTGIIDTGATRSIVTPATRDRLGLARSGKTLATFFTEQYSISLCRPRSIRIGSMEFGPLDLGCHPLEALERAYPGEPAMVIGRDILSRAVLECSFPDRRMRVGPSCSEYALSELGAIDLLRSDYGLPEIAVSVEGGARQRALLDLGSDAACSISASYAEQEGLLDRRTSSTLSAGLEGDVVAQMITLHSIFIGGHELRNVPTCVIADWQSSVPINLGWPAFTAFDLAFIHDRELRLRVRDDALTSSLARDRSGIGAQRYADHLLIRHVACGSPAENVGLKVGDRITCIDKRSIDPTYPRLGLRLGGGTAGTEIDLTMADGRSLHLTLADYF
ncbi:aspartyl protease family protein [Novosphingobium sp. BL-8H]|uniref:aspartyl protease family protein n=1 Tax=Novosphingobium sp. BL-8H TaxID=3127640 RepID=UPI0037575290